MVGVLFLAGAYGAVAALATAIGNVILGASLDPVTVWMLVSGGYVLGWTDGYVPGELRA